MNEQINNRYNLNIFVNTPDKTAEIEVIFHKSKKEIPFFSIVIPIYNQETIIVKNIESIIHKTTEKTYEIILILDSCSDKTEELLLTWAKTNIYNELFVSLLILKSSNPLFETTADNLGFFCAKGKYALEIQSDMEMTEEGYNMKLLKPFSYFDKLIGVSGRCCHNFNSTSGIGKMGKLIEKPLVEITNIDRNSFYIGETCNRGPLLLDLKKLKELGYLDEKNYFLDNSDHDLFARAYEQKNWICGYSPIDFIALLQNGSTRKPRDYLNQTTYENYKKLKLGDFLKNRKIEDFREIKKYRLL